MPNRILREGILSSERVDGLQSWAAECFYRRLMSVVDDFGRYYANPSLLRAACYPLKLDKVSNADVDKWLADCAGAGLVSTYEKDGKRYLQMLDFRQQERAKESKFPQPPITCAANATQARSRQQSNAHLDGDGDGMSTEANASVGVLVLSGGDKPSTPKNLSLSPEVSNTRETWDAYSAAYFSRYGVDPVRNASVNGKLAQFVKRIGAQESPLVAGFYLRSNKSLYVRDKHSVGWLLKDAETLRTEWATGRQGTDTEARQADRTAATGNVFRELIEESHGQQNAA